MQANGELQSDVASLLTSEEQGTGSPVNSRPAPAESRPASHVRGVHSDSDETDIGEYMQRLLKGNSPDKVPLRPAAGKEPALSVRLPNEEGLSPWNPEEYVPRAVAPEKSRNLDALRELANQSNRSALEQSALSRVKSRSTMFRTASIGLAAFGLLFLVLSGFRLDLSMVLGLAALSGSVWASWQSRQTCRRSIAAALPNLPAKAKSDGETTPPVE